MKSIFRYFQVEIKLQKSKMSNVADDFSPFRPVSNRYCGPNIIIKLKFATNSY